MEMKSPEKRLIAFDFDGVICNSAPEMGTSCFDVAIELVAGQGSKKNIPAEMRSEFLNFFGTIRPFLEIGYQGILVALWFIDPEIRNDLTLPAKEGPGTAWEEYLTTLTSKVAVRFPDIFTGEGIYDATLTSMLGKRRDALLNADPDEWLRLNPLYEGIGELLQQLLSDEQNVIAIVSTKQSRFIDAILKNADINITPDLIFGLEAGRKESVISGLIENHSPRFSCFIEDRIETLRRFALDLRFKNLILAFATWGYATPEQHKLAVNDPRIVPVTQVSFVDLLLSS